MEDFEVTVDGEVVRVSEDIGDHGRISYHFTWLNGPEDGTYGWTVGRFAANSSEGPRDVFMARRDLLSEIRGFVSGFYEPGGLGETDFPTHRPAAR